MFVDPELLAPTASDPVLRLAYTPPLALVVVEK
jgi:hypothetical protein